MILPAFISSQISLKTAWPLWLLAALVLAALGLVVIQFLLIRKRLTLPRASLVSALRLTSLLLLIFFALDPSFIKRSIQKITPSLAVLLDLSQSMSLKELPQKDRLGQAKELLGAGKTSLLNSLADKYDVRLYTFGETLRPISPGEVSALNPQEKDSDLLAALSRLATQGQASAPALALVLSDGNLRLDQEGEKAIAGLNIPLWTYPVGDLKGYKDVAIKEIKAPGLAFRGKPVTIDFVVKSYGYQDISFPVILNRGDKVLASKTVRVGADPFQEAYSLTFIPEEASQYQIALSVPHQVGEALTSNNQASLAVNVLRDKIRVLMVSGSPSHNYRILRAALKGDPSVDLLSFVILRTPTRVMNVPVQEQSLIPFPVETLFTKELKNFDLLVFDNFSYAPYFGTNYLDNIKDFVRAGGSFAMLGGKWAFDDGGYANTAIEEILPVKLSGQDNYALGTPSAVGLTTAGKEHPLTRLTADKEENLRLWADMTPLDGYNRLNPGSRGTTLVSLGPGQNRPLLAVGTYGQGRTLALATDQPWKWYMAMVARGQGNQAYLRLVSQMVRWLTHDPSLSLVQLLPMEPLTRLGEEVEIKVKVREEDYTSSASPNITITVTDADGAKDVLNFYPTGRPGEYGAKFVPVREGSYRIKAEARAAGRLLGQDEKVAILSLPKTELADPAPNLGLMKRLAEISKGRVLDNPASVGEKLRAHAPAAQNRVLEERRLALWSTPYALLVILGLLSTEWYLRRKWGLA